MIVAKRPRLNINAPRVPGRALPTERFETYILNAPIDLRPYPEGNFRIVIRNLQGQEIYSAQEIPNLHLLHLNDNYPPTPAIEAWDCILEEEFWIAETLFQLSNIPEGSYIEGPPEDGYEDIEEVLPRRVFDPRGVFSFTVALEVV